jgi:KaiC/GvpD/RAD55 family RecA-like ATPase/PKD repeat protein
MALHNRHNPRKISATLVLILYLTVSATQLLHFSPEANGAPTDLKVYAQAASFARLDLIDPNGWFYQAVLYNPTDTSITVTGLRWWYNASTKIVDNVRAATCYDTRYFSTAPVTLNPSDRIAGWEYTQGSITITVPPRKMILTWIEVPTGSVNNDAILTNYYVEAYATSQWISSPLYLSHSGHDFTASTVFRADFNLTTSPNSELQTHPNPQWLFHENRSVVSGQTSRVRLIPVTVSRNTNGIDYATVNVTMPSGWNYVPGSAYNPYGEAITHYSVAGKDRLKWNLNHDITKYALNQSLVQNYIEFNVTAPATPDIYNFTVTASITSFAPRTTIENQHIHAVVMSPPTAAFTYNPSPSLVNEPVTFDASTSSDLDGTIQSYLWDFDDSQTATGTIVNHTYTNTGNYNVTLAITDNDGLFAIETQIIRICAEPSASFDYSPQIPWVSSSVTFNASTSHDSDGTISIYQWNFDDGNITEVSNPIINHVYHTAGSFAVNLTVLDNDGFTNSVSNTITIVIRDVAVLNVSPSTTEAQAGQQVSITVTVKNKGTTTETFNVTIYYNDNEIETQLAQNLAPNAETTLTFIWNTTGLAQDSSYNIKAETSQIEGETNTTDNNYSTSIRIIPQQNSLDFWGSVRSYVIPILAIIGTALLLTAVTLRRRSNGQTASSIEPDTQPLDPLTDALGGELPEGLSVMIVGDAGSGKSVLCQQLAYRYLSQGKPCIYITYDCFPDEIRKSMQSFGWGISRHEQNENFVFVDCYSPIAGKPSQERYSAKQAFSLWELGTAISTAMDKVNQKSCRVFLDSTAPLFTRVDSSKVIQFLQDRGAQIRGDNGIFFFIVGRGTLQEDLRRKLEEIVDCIIEFDVTEEKTQTARRMRVRKMRGRSFSDQWLSFRIDSRWGLIPVTQKV